MKRLNSYLNTRKTEKVLDVGSGSGAFINAFMKLYEGTGPIIGIDSLPIAVDTGNKNFIDNERVTFMNMDANNMDFDDNTFGIITLSNSLHHLESPEQTFAEMERVLDKYGIIIVNEMIRDGLNKRQKSHLLLHHFAAEIDRATGSYHDETLKGKAIVEKLLALTNLKVKTVFEHDKRKWSENTEEEIKWLLDTMDRLLEKVKEHDNYSYFTKKADKIRKHIEKHGFASATQLVVVLG